LLVVIGYCIRPSYNVLITDLNMNPGIGPGLGPASSLASSGLGSLATSSGLGGLGSLSSSLSSTPTKTGPNPLQQPGLNLGGAGGPLGVLGSGAGPMGTAQGRMNIQDRLRTGMLR
jgi:hypothetical protein